MSFMDAREHGSKIGGAGVASAQVRTASEPQSPDRSNQQRSSAASSLARPIEPSLNLPFPLFLRSTRPSTAGRGSEDWRWRRSTSRRTRTSCETTSEGTTPTPPICQNHQRRTRLGLDPSPFARNPAWPDLEPHRLPNPVSHQLRVQVVPHHPRQRGQLPGAHAG